MLQFHSSVLPLTPDPPLTMLWLQHDGEATRGYERAARRTGLSSLLDKKVGVDSRRLSFVGSQWLEFLALLRISLASSSLAIIVLLHGGRKADVVLGTKYFAANLMKFASTKILIFMACDEQCESIQYKDRKRLTCTNVRDWSDLTMNSEATLLNGIELSNISRARRLERFFSSCWELLFVMVMTVCPRICQIRETSRAVPVV